MKVIVASKNPVKLASVRSAFNAFFSGQSLEYECVEVDSGVSEQPRSLEETIQGAVNRAKRARRNEADFSVGIEGGMTFQSIAGEEYAVEISWVCVCDCKTGITEIASSAGFPVFPRVIRHINAGKTLSEAMHTEYGLENLGQQNGYIGWLSNDRITRESSNYEAVYLALSSLVKQEES